MTTDLIDETRASWQRLHPHLDTAPMATMGRILRIARLATLFSDQLLAAHGLSRGEFDVLSAVRRSSVALTPSQLAKLLAASNASITKRLVALERAGLARREHTSADRRVVTVVATALGVERIDGALPAQLDLERALTGGLSAAQAAALETTLRGVLTECEGRAR
ncbi:MarR family transcriptional regulator [Subtercola sp. Z020]|uniref:MarR family winged helix-turn-helix transcriptional regulator n=1 Tax=Subtercola sp. Z020 TaxID=2080582 RepID=UPI000CE87D0B|nr:MarR family transcriptional regulator [Subtercola sp. Z020]PPF82736.1 MarR family transcriptional regulator [Subtercola sp. Z020]